MREGRERERVAERKRERERTNARESERPEGEREESRAVDDSGGLGNRIVIIVYTSVFYELSVALVR